MPSTFKKYYKLWVRSAKRSALIAATISTIFVFTGTASPAGSNPFHRYYGLSFEHWKSRYNHFVRSQKRERHRLLKQRHLRPHKHRFLSFGVLGGYHVRSDSDDSIQINLILPPDKKEENSGVIKEAREPLPPHIETLTKGNNNAVSSYQTVNSADTAAHIVEYRGQRQ